MGGRGATSDEAGATETAAWWTHEVSQVRLCCRGSCAGCWGRKSGNVNSVMKTVPWAGAQVLVYRAVKKVNEKTAENSDSFPALLFRRSCRAWVPTPLLLLLVVLCAVRSPLVFVGCMCRLRAQAGPVSSWYASEISWNLTCACTHVHVTRIVAATCYGQIRCGILLQPGEAPSGGGNHGRSAHVRGCELGLAVSAGVGRREAD